MHHTVVLTRGRFRLCILADCRVAKKRYAGAQLVRNVQNPRHNVVELFPCAVLLSCAVVTRIFWRTKCAKNTSKPIYVFANWCTVDMKTVVWVFLRNLRFIAIWSLFMEEVDWGQVGLSLTLLLVVVQHLAGGITNMQYSLVRFSPNMPVAKSSIQGPEQPLSVILVKRLPASKTNLPSYSQVSSLANSRCRQYWFAVFTLAMRVYWLCRSLISVQSCQ